MKIYDFGLLLRELREKRGMTQADVARKLGLKQATISRYECNTKTPSLASLKRLALLFGVSSDYLLGLLDR